MGQSSMGDRGHKPSHDITGHYSTTPGLDLRGNDTKIQSVGWSFHETDMNNTDTSLTTDLIRDRLDFDEFVIRTTAASAPLSKDQIWTWNSLHIAVVSVAAILLFIVILSMLCLVYHKRIFRARANVSFSGTPPYVQARSKIFSRFAAEERARRLAESQETLRRTTPSPVSVKSVNEEIPMTLLNQMQSVPDIHNNGNDEISGTIHQETQIDGTLHHRSIPLTQLDRVPSRSLPRHHVRTFSNKKSRVFPRHVGSDLNGNITHSMPMHDFNSQYDWRSFPGKAIDPRLDLARRRRLLSEPLMRRVCACHYHRAMTQVRHGREHRMSHSYRSRLPKFNLAGENIPTSSEPSVIDGGTRAPDNSFEAEDDRRGPYSERRPPNFNNNQDLYQSYGPPCAVNNFAFHEGRAPTPRVPTNTPNSNCSGSIINLERHGNNIGHVLDSDFGASAGASQCNVSSDTSMTVAVGTACSSDQGSTRDVADFSYEWDGYDPAYNSQVLEFIDGEYFPVLNTRQYWV